MKRRIMVLLAAAMVMFALWGCNSSVNQDAGSAQQTESAPSGEVMVFAAKSMTDCMNDLIEAYNKTNPNVTISVNYASSGDLQSQIENGAPCDIFLSAAQTQMDTLCEQDLIAIDTRSDFLTNEAVLVVPSDSATAIQSFSDLATDAVSRVSIGNPDSVPAGQYAQTILTNLGIWDSIYAKAVLGSDVRQVLAWCETGEVDAGIVYATDAAITDGVKMVCAAPSDSCDPVVYPVALTKSGVENTAAVDFLAYCKTEEAGGIAESYGFGLA